MVSEVQLFIGLVAAYVIIKCFLITHSMHRVKIMVEKIPNFPP